MQLTTLAMDHQPVGLPVHRPINNTMITDLARETETKTKNQHDDSSLPAQLKSKSCIQLAHAMPLHSKSNYIEYAALKTGIKFFVSSI